MRALWSACGPALVVAIAASSALAAAADVSPASDAAYVPGPADVVKPGDLPEIGKWMLDRSLRPAAWLNELFRGKTLREPINVIIVDPFASSPQDATERLLRACTAGGYPSREGHSGGYHGFVDGILHAQIPSTKGHAFANHPFELHNNHGRIFGPHRVKDGWLFIGAFSREKLVPLTRSEHVFVSFNEARDDFARRLEDAAGFRRVGSVDLHNALADHPLITTGDHDGKAVVLRAQK